MSISNEELIEQRNEMIDVLLECYQYFLHCNQSPCRCGCEETAKKVSFILRKYKLEQLLNKS